MKSPFEEINFFRGGWRVIADKRSDHENSAELFLTAIDVFQRWSNGRPLSYLGSEPMPSDGEGTIRSFVATSIQRQLAGEATPILATDNAANPSVVVALEPAVVANRASDRVWLSVNDAPPPKSNEDAAEFINRIAQRVRLTQAFLENEALAALYFGRSAAACARAAIPDHLREFVPEPALPPEAGVVRFDFLLPDQFDNSAAPSAIWQVNLFGIKQVENIGRSRLLSASWDCAEELPGGEVLSVVEMGFPGEISSGLIAHIHAIAEELDISKLQRAASFDGVAAP